MENYTIKESQRIPYFDHGKSLHETIQNSSKRRGMSKWHFVWRKIRNIILDKMAYSCPLNSWRVWMHRHRGVTIGQNVYIGQHTTIDNAYPEYVYIEDNVSIAGGNIILGHSNPYVHFSNILESGVSPIVIKEGAWIGVGAIILRGVTIGERSIVTAGSVVDKDVDNYTMVRGNPAKKITEYKILLTQ